MKKIILYYFYSLLLFPIVLRVLLGDLSGIQFHPGQVVRSIILILLSIHFLKSREYRNLGNIFVKLFWGFLVSYFFSLIIIEFLLYKNFIAITSISYAAKVLLLPLLACYVYLNGDYFKSKFDSIMLLNSLVLIINIIVGYYFQIGWQSYEGVEDSYRGFLVGNDTSVFTFITFGYGLFKLEKNKIVGSLIIFLSLFCLFIIATKAIYVATLIVVLKLLGSKNVTKKSIITISVSVLLIIVFITIVGWDQLFDRIFSTYSKQVNEGLIYFSDFNEIPMSLIWLNYISPARFIYGILMLIEQFNSSILNILFGFGYSSIYDAFGRPPMAELFLFQGYFGLFGLFLFIGPQLKYVTNLVFSKKFDLVNILLITIFLYGALGGFLYDVSTTAAFFGLVFGLSYDSQKPNFFKKSKLKNESFDSM